MNWSKLTLGNVSMWRGPSCHLDVGWAQCCVLLHSLSTQRVARTSPRTVCHRVTHGVLNCVCRVYTCDQKLLLPYAGAFLRWSSVKTLGFKVGGFGVSGQRWLHTAYCILRVCKTPSFFQFHWVFLFLSLSWCVHRFIIFFFYKNEDAIKSS